MGPTSWACVAWAVFASLATTACAREIKFGDVGGVAGSDGLEVAWANGSLLNTTLNALKPGDVFVIEQGKTYTTMGGIHVHNISDVVVSIDGTLRFSDELSEWPRSAGRTDIGQEGGHATPSAGHVLECIEFTQSRNLTFTSKSKLGVLDGNGHRWWGLPGIGYVIREEDRPRLLATTDCSDVVVENLLFIDPPYWTTMFRRVDGLVIRHSHISARRTNRDSHKLLDLTAFNTDGFDFTGRNIHVHDVSVYSQDDCIAVKDGTENVLIERVNASGVGLTIGSIGGSNVRNVTFRDSVLHNTHKGIYLKFRRNENPGTISDITYENILIEGASQWPIWVGPAQQSDTRDLCYANPCSICWPLIPGAECAGQKDKIYSNLVFRNIEIRNPHGSPGVILADPDYPIDGIVFEDVRVTHCQEPGSFEERFPNLPSEIYDPFVTYFSLLILAGVAVFVALPCAVCWRKGCCTVGFWREHRRTRICVIALVVLLVLGAALVLGWVAHVNAGTGDHENYYKCEGVKGGVATGSTWPVPSCFQDNTDATAVATKPCKNVGAIAGGVVGGLAAACLLALLAVRVLRPEAYARSRSALARRMPCSRNDAVEPSKELQA